MLKTLFLAAFAFSCCLTLNVSAHDTWIQTNSPIVRTGEVAHVDLRLGNHGNHHRDFKLAGLLTLDWTSMDWISPSGKRVDLKPDLYTSASAEKQGYWTTPVTLDEPGAHLFVQKLDRVMNHGKSIRSIRTSKALVVCSPTLDNISNDSHSHSTPAGLPFELVLHQCPMTEIEVGQPITVTVLHNGEPLANALVAFIPEGETLTGDTDPDHEFTTGTDGTVSFTPSKATRYLIAAHHTAMDEKSTDYEFTSYATTIALQIPNRVFAQPAK